MVGLSAFLAWSWVSMELQNLSVITLGSFNGSRKKLDLSSCRMKSMGTQGSEMVVACSGMLLWRGRAGQSAGLHVAPLLHFWAQQGDRNLFPVYSRLDVDRCLSCLNWECQCVAGFSYQEYHFFSSFVSAARWYRNVGNYGKRWTVSKLLYHSPRFLSLLRSWTE